MSKKSLVIIGSVPPPYHGSNVALKSVLESRIQDAFDITHIDTSDRRDASNIGQLDMGNVTLGLKAARDSFLTCLKKKPDGFYICIAQAKLAYVRDAMCFLAAKAASPKTKVIVHLHGGYFQEFYNNSSPQVRGFIDFSMKSVSHAIVLGGSLRYIFKTWLPDEKIHVVPNGTDVNIAIEEKFAAADTPAALKLLYMSSIIPSKGIFDVLDAVALFKKNTGEISLAIAGERGFDDPYDGMKGEEILKIFKEKVDNLSNSARDEKLLKGDNKSSELLKADVVLLPTFYPMEGLPITILEAMASGCVVISTRHAAIPEVVVHGETGFLVEKHKPEEIFVFLKMLHEDRALLKKMQRAARKRYEELYTAEKSNGRLIEVLQTCLAV